MLLPLQKEKRCLELLDDLVWPQRHHAAVKAIADLGPDILVRLLKMTCHEVILSQATLQGPEQDL